MPSASKRCNLLMQSSSCLRSAPRLIFALLRLLFFVRGIAETERTMTTVLESTCKVGQDGVEVRLENETDP